MMRPLNNLWPNLWTQRVYRVYMTSHSVYQSPDELRTAVEQLSSQRSLTLYARAVETNASSNSSFANAVAKLICTRSSSVGTLKNPNSRFFWTFLIIWALRRLQEGQRQNTLQFCFLKKFVEDLEKQLPFELFASKLRVPADSWLQSLLGFLAHLEHLTNQLQVRPQSCIWSDHEAPTSPEIRISVAFSKHFPSPGLRIYQI